MWHRSEPGGDEDYLWEGLQASRSWSVDANREEGLRAKVRRLEAGLDYEKESLKRENELLHKEVARLKGENATLRAVEGGGGTADGAVGREEEVDADADEDEDEGYDDDVDDVEGNFDRLEEVFGEEQGFDDENVKAGSFTPPPKQPDEDHVTITKMFEIDGSQTPPSQNPPDTVNETPNTQPDEDEDDYD